MNLMVINQPFAAGPHLSTPLDVPMGALLWQTCMRRTLFLQQESAEAHSLRDLSLKSQLECYEAGSAYVFLLQVLCGLKSDMLGETEVLGQFKTFLQNHAQHDLVAQDPLLWNCLLRDSKIVRERYLKNLGCHSYGSLARKLLRENLGPVAMIGAGQLAQEIMPWLKSHAQISLFTRDAAKAKLAMASRECTVLGLQDIKESELAATALLVCAPVQNSELEANIQVLRLKNPNLKVLDFRGEAQLQASANYFSFENLMGLVSEDRSRAQVQVEKAQSLIQELAQEYIGRIQLRPLGWEDLCS
jgi:glutamyl-tRNA reductase